MTNGELVAEGVRNWIHTMDIEPVWKPTALWGNVFIQRMLDGILVKGHCNDGSYIVAEVKSRDIEEVTNLAVWVHCACSVDKFPPRV